MIGPHMALPCVTPLCLERKVERDQELLCFDRIKSAANVIESHFCFNKGYTSSFNYTNEYTMQIHLLAPLIYTWIY